MRGIVWFREDLRTHDHTALTEATKTCSDGIIAIYLIDTHMWQKHHMAACRIEFILRGLQNLKDNLAALNIPLIVHTVEHHTVAEIILELLEKHQASTLFFNRQYEINEIKRDQIVEALLASQNYKIYSYHDTTILNPGSVTTQQNEYFKVFTAYKNAWYKVFLDKKITTQKSLKPQAPLNIKTSSFSQQMISTIDPALWPAGETEAKKRLITFIKNNLTHYDKKRDFPAIQGTSLLSPYLSAGMISARQCFLSAFDANQHELDTGKKGAVTWMIELIWRDFYKHLLVALPKLSMRQPFKSETEKLRWNFDEAQFKAWQQGLTGIPIVDAGMRQLNTTGWMHNRVRMIVAMFFTKNLFFDWRLGEEYFIRHLIDGDLAANNGGWQWSASTGTDAAPYFRIFNPILQSEKFDKNGDYIRTYCPELKDFDSHAIHAPYERMPLLAKQIHYPQPIVDLKKSRLKTIAEFKRIKL